MLPQEIIMAFIQQQIFLLLPDVFETFRNDADLIIKEFNKDNIRVIAETKVKYIRFNFKISAC